MLPILKLKQVILQVVEVLITMVLIPKHKLMKAL